MHEAQPGIIIIHPSTADIIRYLSPRDRWKHEQRIRRWERRYDKSYVLTKMVVGTIEGVRFVTNQKRQ